MTSYSTSTRTLWCGDRMTTPWDATIVAAAAGWGAVLPLAIAAAVRRHDRQPTDREAPRMNHYHARPISVSEYDLPIGTVDYEGVAADTSRVAIFYGEGQAIALDATAAASLVADLDAALTQATTGAGGPR